MKYAFLDRDGTLLYEPQTDYTVVSSELLPGVEDALLELQMNGYGLVMVSNQDGLGTPMNPQDNFDRVQCEFLETCEQKGIAFKDIFLCPHMPEENCICRKPQTKLVEELDIDKDSIVIGDRQSDVDLASNLQIRVIKIETNKGFSYEDTQSHN
ncbi:histidinol-phosphatase [Candidatus Saccharibacteria bacterium]|jgi:imidazoleglycerol-phosphate dehydratase/histidinol-phosphatase|nr:histidinol-phosphatase [Candidatus Saccharibacteria bacterium]